MHAMESFIYNYHFNISICNISYHFFLTILKCHTNIKNYIYLLRVYSYRKQGYAPITDSDDFEYHAFVVYCDADRLWVHNEFVKKLEKEEGVRLCIHHRDFEVEDSISGNIDNILKKS